MEVHEPTADLCSVELDSVSTQSGLANVMNVEIQVPAAHHGQDQTEGLFGLIGIRQVHLRGGRRSTAVNKNTSGNGAAALLLLQQQEMFYFKRN